MAEDALIFSHCGHDTYSFQFIIIFATFTIKGGMSGSLTSHSLYKTSLIPKLGII